MLCPLYGQTSDNYVTRSMKDNSMNASKQMSEEAKSRILKATKVALDRNGGKAGGWAGKQQVDAIISAIADEVGGEMKDYDDSALREVVNFFSNASATAQYMEKTGVIEKRVGRTAKRENIFAGFNT